MADDITSRENPVVKLCRKIRSGAKGRREEGLFLAEGARLCREDLESGLPVRTLLATREALERYPWFRDRACGAAEVRLVSPGVAEAISDTSTPQGVFCVCALPPRREPVLEPLGRYLLLDRLQDPGNLGSIIRGAEAFGITALVLSDGCPDPFSPKALRGTMGSAFRQPLFFQPELPGLIRQMREAGIAVCAAALDPGGLPAAALAERRGGLAVVVGNEGAGVSPEVLAACAATVHIPMTHRIESLNAAAAATVLMWEMAGRGRCGRKGGEW